MTPLSRRRFIGTAAAAVGVQAFVSRRTAAQDAAASGANGRLRVGLIGCGGMGTGDLETFLKVPEVDCPVVCDVDDGHAGVCAALVEKQRGRRPDMTRDFRRVLDRKDVDAVVVATPDHWHALPTVLACQAGKDVYVEKPLAKSIAEGRAMVEAAKRHGRVAQMGTQWPSNPHFQDAVAFVRSGRLGCIRFVRCWAYIDWKGDIGNPPDGPPPAGVDYDLWLGPAPLRPFNPNRFHYNFRWFWDYAGGLMTDWGVHLLNVGLWGMGYSGPPRTVSSTGGKLEHKDNAETSDTQVTIYEFPGYRLIWEHVAGCAIGPNGRPWGVAFTGSEGTLVVNGDGWEVIPEPKKKSLEAAKHPGKAECRLEHVRNFLDCVRTREAPVMHLGKGQFSSTVAHLGNVAYRTGRTVVWDADKEQVAGDAEADRLVGVTYRKPWELPYYPQ